MKTISLRRAARIRSKLDELIDQKTSEFNDNSTKIVNVSDWNVPEQLDAAMKLSLAAIADVRNFSSTRQVIRAAIARVNAASGVADALAHIARNTLVASTLTRTVTSRYAVLQTRPTDEQLTARLAARRKQMEVVTSSVSDQVAYGTLAQADVDSMHAEIKQLEDENEGLRETVEMLNATTVIALDDEVVSKLLEAGIAV